jgi:hypothetical protein
MNINLKSRRLIITLDEKNNHLSNYCIIVLIKKKIIEIKKLLNEYLNLSI